MLAQQTSQPSFRELLFYLPRRHANNASAVLCGGVGCRVRISGPDQIGWLAPGRIGDRNALCPSLPSLDDMVRLDAFQQQFQRATVPAERLNLDSILRWRTGALVYQAPDWPCYINALELNRGSIYGDLVIARAESTP